MAATLNLTAFKRVPFVESDGATIVHIGPDWSDAAFKMDIRQAPGDTGTPIITLATATAGSQGISATYEAAYLFQVNGTPTTAPATKILIQIDEATIEALDLGTPPDEPVELYYDLHATPSGGIKRVLCEGKFTIKPGATI
ncbi:MAG: hypothetical protein ACK4ZW_08625 [Blastomonas sp.]